MSLENPTYILNELTPDQLDHIDIFLTEIEGILRYKFTKNEIDALLKIERERIFEDLQFNDIVENKIDLEIILNRRKNQLLDSINKDEKNEIIYLFPKFHLKEKLKSWLNIFSTPYNLIQQKFTTKNKQYVKDRNNYDIYSPFMSQQLITIEINTKKYNQYQSLGNKIFNLKNNSFIAFIVIYFSIIQYFYLSNNSRDFVFYNFGIDPHAFDLISFLIFMFFFFILFVKITYGFVIWYSRRPSKYVINILNLHQISMPYSELLSLNFDMHPNQFLQILGDLIHHKIIQVKEVNL